MATGETFRATIIAEHEDGTAIVNDFGYVDLAGGSAHLDTGIAAGNFQTLVQAKFLAMMDVSVTIRRYRFACVGGTHKGEIGYVEAAAGLSGLQNAGILPKEICISIKRSTGHASKKDRGRIFFGPVSVSYFDPAHPDSVQNIDDAPLVALRDLLKANLTVSGVTLSPVILNSVGGYSGNVINQVAIGTEFVHRKTRRVRSGA